MAKHLFKSILTLTVLLLLTGFQWNLLQDGASIKVPQGFKVTTVATDLGGARHIAITPSGIIYIKLSNANNGGGIVMMKNGEVVKKFGNYGGTGIRVHGNYLFASSNSEVFRYTLNEQGEVTNPDNPETIVTGLVDRRTHNSKSITFDNNGNIYVNIGAYSNACQETDRTRGSPGQNPCPILEHAGGIWQFKADKTGQSYGDGKRYATGLRNVVGLDWNNESNQLFVMQHGRDQLNNLYPEYFTAQQSAELPSEAMYALKEGDDAGWPYIYWDHIEKKKILAPEYGGDGKKTGKPEAIEPVVGFPGHMAPNDLLFYTGNMFPEKYKNGAFIAFHGSWNRAPEPQKGYFVAFVPFRNGRPSGDWEIFADNFSGTETVNNPNQAQHRPAGLAQGPDGSLYVTDDRNGALFRITYSK